MLTASIAGYHKVREFNAAKPRPNKVTLASPEAVKFVLSKASRLKETHTHIGNVSICHQAEAKTRELHTANLWLKLAENWR